MLILALMLIYVISYKMIRLRVLSGFLKDEFCFFHCTYQDVEEHPPILQREIKIMGKTHNTKLICNLT